MAYLYVEADTSDEDKATKTVVGFDRDLSIAGRAMVKTSDGKIEAKLVKVDRPCTSPLSISTFRSC